MLKDSSPHFLAKLSAISEDALVAWDRVDINYEERAAGATPMWFAERMNVCRKVKYHRRREAPYVTVHGCEVAVWIEGRWIVRELNESADAFWQRVLYDA